MEGWEFRGCAENCFFSGQIGKYTGISATSRAFRHAGRAFRRARRAYRRWVHMKIFELRNGWRARALWCRADRRSTRAFRRAGRAFRRAEMPVYFGHGQFGNITGETPFREQTPGTPRATSHEFHFLDTKRSQSTGTQ